MRQYTQNETIRSSFKKFKGDTINDKELRSSIADSFYAASKKDNTFYAQMLDFVISILEDFDSKDLEKSELLYKFLIFMDNDLDDKPYLYDSNEYNPPKVTPVLVVKHHRLYAAIQPLLEIDNFHIFDTLHPHDYYKGDFWEIIEFIFDMYYKTGGFYKYNEDEETKPMMVDMAELVPVYYKNFVDAGKRDAYIVFEYHKNYHEEHAKLIDLFLTRDNESNLFKYLDQMLTAGEFNKDRVQTEAKKILAFALPMTKEWESSKYKSFIEHLVFEPLQMIYKDYDTSLVSVIINEEWNNKRLEEDPNAWTHFDPDRKLIRESFDLYKEAKYKRAVKTVAISNSIFSTLKYIQKTFKNHEYSAFVDTLVADAQSFKNRPKLYNLNTKPSIVFKDFAFKLLVIENLMYTNKKLTPKFELNLFAEESKREIDPDSDGYDPIPEVKKFYKNLDIPQELLDGITELHVGLGFEDEAYSETYINMWPQFDPGCQERIGLKTKALEDAELLPNLKKIEGYGFDEVFSKRVLNGFVKRGVEMNALEY